MIVYLWSAGNAVGVTDSERQARVNADTCMRSQQVDTALIERAHFIGGIESLVTGYVVAARDPYWIAQRHSSGRISWRMHQRAPELAAS